MSMRNDEPVTSVPKNGHGGDQEREESHPAFGVAVVTRGTGSGRTLFQSDLRHNETISLRIETADRTRALNRDWVHPRKTLIEVEMSLAQWGALVSSIGIGSGVPVTIRSTESVYRVPGIPYEPRIAENIKETRGAVGKMLARARETYAALEEAIEQKKGVRAIREALRNHRNSLGHAESNSEFAVKSLTEAAENVTSQARADIEAHVLAAAQITGLTAPVEFPELTVGESDAPAIEQ